MHAYAQSRLALHLSSLARSASTFNPVVVYANCAQPSFETLGQTMLVSTWVSNRSWDYNGFLQDITSADGDLGFRYSS